MPSPMLAVEDRSKSYRTVKPAHIVEVYIDSESVTGWFVGQLHEWTHYEGHGWTGWVQYSLASAEQYNGRFLAENIRELTVA